MMNLFLVFLSISLTVGFLGLIHPLALGLTLLIQTFLISLIMGLTIDSFWLSYMLYLVFLGGMLVLFLYTTSLASNEIFKFNFTFGFVCLGLSFVCCFGIHKLLPLFPLLNQPPIPHWEPLQAPLGVFDNLMPLYSYPTFGLIAFMAWYLLISLLVVAKIINIHAGPLRSGS